VKLGHPPLFATDRTAAALLDMKHGEFLALVKAGHLPPPIELASGVKRWDVQQLRSIISGNAADQELQW
jgi:hypothetical protein